MTPDNFFKQRWQEVGAVVRPVTRCPFPERQVLLPERLRARKEVYKMYFPVAWRGLSRRGQKVREACLLQIYRIKWAWELRRGEQEGEYSN